MTDSKAVRAEKEKARAEKEAAAEATTAAPIQTEATELQGEDGSEGYEEEGEDTVAGAPQTLPSDAPDATVVDEADVSAPLSADEEEEVEETKEADPGDQPLPKEYVVLNGPASYGPVRIGGKLVRALKNKLYYVPDPVERADVLGTGRFRAGTKADMARADAPSSGPGGALTRDLLPPGAIKGGLVKP
jgi:hypothetical protein